MEGRENEWNERKERVQVRSPSCRLADTRESQGSGPISVRRPRTDRSHVRSPFFFSLLSLVSRPKVIYFYRTAFKDRISMSLSLGRQKDQKKLWRNTRFRIRGNAVHSLRNRCRRSGTIFRHQFQDRSLLSKTAAMVIEDTGDIDWTVVLCFP